MSMFSKKHSFTLFLCALMLSFTTFAQNQRSTSERVKQLPPGHLLRSSFEGLPPQAKAKAENWLNRLTIPEEDFNSIKIDNQGGVYYADSFPAQTQSADSSPSEPVVSQAVPNSTDVFKLHSKPGAPYTIHLDFDGMVITGRAWNNGGASSYDARAFSIDGNYSNFNEAERAHITSVWQRVSDDYASFNVDVTTEEPSSYGPYVAHALITRTVDANGVSMPGGGGGIAYVGVFGGSNNVYYSPAITYYDNSANEHGNANTTSHEVGHNLGLSHHGGGGDGEYYRGHGSGFISWSPLMGSSYYTHVTQWDHGSYSGANNSGQNDINLISGHFGYRTDDHGNNISNATPLIIENDGSVNVIHEEIDPFDQSSNNKGIIERSSDLDFFSFTTSGGQVNLTITPSYIAFDDDTYRSSNLDVRAKLYNSSGSLINTYNYSSDLKADISTSLSTGTYYLSIEGEGSSNYSDYSSIGKYYISGSINGGTVNDGSINFAMLGDFGEDDSQASSVANLVNSWDIDFVTTAGDNRYGSIDFHQAVGNKYCQWIANPGISCTGEATTNKFFPAPGNHDYDDGGGINEYLNYFDLPGNGVSSSNTSGNERYYDVIQGDVHFFMIDSDQARSSSTDRAAQQNWLQTQLAASTANWKVVLAHHAPYSSGNHGSDPVMQWPFADWGVDVVMAGHDHHYERIHKDGVVYIVNGLGGRSIYQVGAPISGSQVLYNGDYGAVLASVDGDTMNVKFINVAGSTIDDYNITKSTPPPIDGIVDVQITNSNDDTEERSSDGSMHPTSSDIELGDDPGFNEDQTVGLLFRNINIPQGATITYAYLEFTVDEADSDAANISIKAEDVDNAPDFSTSNNNLSTRTTTSASVNWSIPAWSGIGSTQQSPNISSVVQEIIDRGGWSSGNKLAFLITGTGSRTAEAFDGSPGSAARLHVEYDVIPPTEGIVDVQITGFMDDVEERASDGVVDENSTDIELGDDPGFNEDQTIGLLFRNIEVPQGSNITSAYLEFTVDEIDTAVTDLTVKAQSADNASDFTLSAYNISNRTTTTSSVNWSVPSWNTVGSNQQSPDLTALVQEVVNRPGWSSGNKIAFIIAGTGSRTAEAYDGAPGSAARLHIEYGEEVPNIAPTAEFTFNIADRTVTFTDTSSDSDGTIASWSWDFGDGNTTTDQNPVYTYSSDDTFTVTLTVTDDQGATHSTSSSIITCLDSDNDGVCDNLDICPGGDDNIDTDGDGIPDFCDTCNELIDSDNDGYNDCIDQEPNSPCPSNVDANGVSIDSDGDGVANCLDICNGSDDSVDTDGDGTPDGCDIEECDGLDNDGDGQVDEGYPDSDNDGIADCVDTSTCVATTVLASFQTSPLTATGSQAVITSDNNSLPDGAQNISFTISDMNHRTGGKPTNRFIEEVTVKYDDGTGEKTYGTFGSGNSVVDVIISGPVQSVSVSLTDGYDGNTSQNLSVTLSDINFCKETVQCDKDSDGDGVCDPDDNCPNTANPGQEDTDGDGIGDVCDSCTDSDGDNVCDPVDICPGSNDNLDADQDGVPDGCDNCPNTFNPGQEDTDGDGIGDACDTADCTPTTGSFGLSTLTTTNNITTATIPNGAEDVTFTISGIGQRLKGKSSSHYIEEVTVSYTTIVNGISTHVFNGSNTSTETLVINGLTSDITVSLADAYDDNVTSGNMNVSLSIIDYCDNSAPAPAAASLSASESEFIPRDINVYPNPASRVINVSLKGFDVLEAKVNMYSFNGQLVLNKAIGNTASSLIELNDLADGLYLMIIKDGEGNNLASKRIVVKQ